VNLGGTAKRVSIFPKHDISLYTSKINISAYSTKRAQKINKKHVQIQYISILIVLTQ